MGCKPVVQRVREGRRGRGSYRVKVWIKGIRERTRKREEKIKRRKSKRNGSRNEKTRRNGGTRSTRKKRKDGE